METNISLRALEYCKYKGITATDFERLTGLANRMLKKLGERTRNQTYLRISKAFPDSDIDWLRTDQGEMLQRIPTISQSGDGSVFQNGQAGRDLNQTNNSEKLLLKFIDGMKSLYKLTKKAMSQTEKVIDQMGKTIDEMSEQRKLMDRLITLYENK